MNTRSHKSAFLPVPGWLKHYPREHLPDDLVAGLITAALLVPQGMAYAILAGLPAEVGLYASIVPAIVYGFLGTSRTMSVGPVSVAALLVADALIASGQTPNSEAYLADALLLSALAGLILLAMALFRLGVLVNFISHPVLSGFISGAALLIVISQIPNLTGIEVARGGSGLEMAVDLLTGLGSIQLTTLILGSASVVALLLLKAPLVRTLEGLGLNSRWANLISRAGPLAVVAVLTAVVAALRLDRSGVAIVGNIPAGLPTPTLAFLRPDQMAGLLPSALIISLIAYVESVSVAKVLAYRRREKVGSNRELGALGAANLAAAFSGGMPVAGGFSRSMVNFSAGARTQLATMLAAVLVGLAALFFTPLFYYLPKAALAAIIVVAVAPLFDWRAALNTWRYDRADGATLLLTFAASLLVDIEVGLVAGVVLALAVFLWRSSRPHVAVVGRIPGTEHFRNVERHPVQTWPGVLLLRIDRSLFFANLSYLEDLISSRVAAQPDLRHLILICNGVNTIDHSAVESLEQLAENLREAGVTLHLAEVKGPVMDRLKTSHLLQTMAPGQVYLSTEEAVRELAPEADQQASNA